MRPYLLCSLLAITLITSCLGPQEKPVTKEEALIMARNIDSAIATGNEEQYFGLIQMDVFMQRVSKASDKEYASSAKRGFKAGIKSANLGGQIINASKDGKGFYQLVKHYEKNKIQHLVYRLYTEGGLNYHDYELTKVGSKVYVADIFFYLTGENFSKTASDLLDNLEATASESKKGQTEMFKRLKRLMADGKWKEAKKLFDNFPASLKERKAMQINYLAIANGLGEEEYAKALFDFEAKFKHEPYMFLSLIDAYGLRKDYKRVQEIINQLDSMIDKDSFLDYHRGMFYNEMGQLDEGTRSFEKVTSNFPDFQDGLTMLIINYLESKEYDKAKPKIAAYRQNERFNQQSLDEYLLAYPGYVSWEQQQQ